MYVLREVLHSFKNVANKFWTRHMKQANREYKSDYSPSVKQLESLWWKKRRIRTTDTAKEEQLAKMVTKSLQVASEWPSVFMTILVSSYAPAVSTLKLWWICNFIDLILGFPFLHQEFKTFILYSVAVFVVVTPRATVCKCGTDEKKVRGRSLLFSWKYTRCFLDFYWCPVLARLCRLFKSAKQNKPNL